MAVKRSPKEIANDIARESDCDIAIYNGIIGRFLDEDVILKALERKRRQKLLMILVTEGGDPDSAYRIARCLQTKYKHFTLFVSGFCKSAGTLVAIGAHELVFSDHGELGPVDVQMAKKDELLDRQSSLTVIAALDFLREKAYSSFEQIFYDLEDKTSGIVTVQTASKIAIEIVTSFISPIASQIDPLHIGDAARSLRIAEQYGVRLAQVSKSIQRENMLRLLTSYASHGFVIDRREAGLLFSNVRDPTPLEHELADSLGNNARRPMARRQLGTVTSVFDFLSDPMQTRAGARHAKRNAKTSRARPVAPVSRVQPARDSAGARTGAQAGTRSERKQADGSKRPAASSRPRRGARKENGLGAASN